MYIAPYGAKQTKSNQILSLPLSWGTQKSVLKQDKLQKQAALISI